MSAIPEDPLNNSERQELEYRRRWDMYMRRDADFQAYAEIKEQFAGLVARIRELEQEGR